ncbi:ABC transporter ATP-binding protein [Exiguobacterium acetylicum]|uniref:ABC transporter permease n=1 Tax=Exiguobacterium acetylicum TaxID=41170 RepID=UPI000A72701A|nr:ABC transporter ATP-binding protein [Exiguobacterium acetylicum]
MIAGPKIMGTAITELFEGHMPKFQGVPGAAIDFTKIGQILLWLAGLYIISSLFNYLQQYLMSGIRSKTVYDLREDVNHKLRTPAVKILRWSSERGDTQPRDERYRYDRQYVTTKCDIVHHSIVTIVGILIMMLTISPLLTLISLVSLPVSIFANSSILKRSQKYFADQQRTLGQLNGHVEEMYTGHSVVKAFGHERKAVEQF